jgi:hypothetical protein
MPDLPQVNYKGKLKSINDKVVVLTLDDGRTASFQRSGKTKFYKDSKEIKSSDLHIGDHLSIDAAEDPQAFLDALKVTFDNSPPTEVASGENTTNSSQNLPSSIQYDEHGRPTLRKRNPTDSGGGAGEEPGSGSSAQPASIRDNGRPTLKRRGPAGTEDSDADVPEVPGTPVPEMPVPSSRGPSDISRAEDPAIEKARTMAISAPGNFPDFLCEETMARSSRDSSASSWQPIDVVSAEVSYADGKENHLSVKIDNQPAKTDEMSGSWPIRRLVTALSDLFSPAAQTQFQFGGESNLVNLQARVYDFDVKAENSQWTMRMASQSINAAYGGSVWIEKDTGRVLRLEMQARGLPEGFPMDSVETDVEYSLVRIGKQSALMPMHAETMGCERSTRTCSRSIIDIHNYRPSNPGSKAP